MAIKTNYQAVLTSSNVKEADLLPKTAEMLKTVKELEGTIADLYADRSSANTEDQAQINADIERAEGVLSNLDAQLCKKIEKNTFFKENAAKMRAAAAKGKGAKQSPPPAPAEPTPTAGEGGSTPPAPAEPIVVPPIEEPIVEESKWGFWDYVVAIGATVATVAFGVNVYNKMKE